MIRSQKCIGTYSLTIENNQLLFISEDQNFSWRWQRHLAIFEPPRLLFRQGRCRRATAGRRFLPIPVVGIKVIPRLCSQEQKVISSIYAEWHFFSPWGSSSLNFSLALTDWMAPILAIFVTWLAIVQRVWWNHSVVILHHSNRAPKILKKAAGRHSSLQRNSRFK